MTWSRSSTRRFLRSSERSPIVGNDARATATRSTLLAEPDRLADKVREEADEVARAAAGESDERVAQEAADVLYHLAVLLASRGLSLEPALRELNGRRR